MPYRSSGGRERRAQGQVLPWPACAPLRSSAGTGPCSSAARPPAPLPTGSGARHTVPSGLSGPGGRVRRTAGAARQAGGLPADEGLRHRRRRRAHGRARTGPGRPGMAAPARRSWRTARFRHGRPRRHGPVPGLGPADGPPRRHRGPPVRAGPFPVRLRPGRRAAWPGEHLPDRLAMPKAKRGHSGESRAGCPPPALALAPDGSGSVRRPRACPGSAAERDTMFGMLEPPGAGPGAAASRRLLPARQRA